MSRIGDTGNSGSPDVSEATQKIGEDLRELGGQVREAAKEKYERLSGQAQAYYEQGRETAQEWEKTVEDFVHEKPVQAVLIAAGVGVLVGLLLGRR